MTTITDYFAQAQLSLAAYALNLQQGMSGSNQAPAYIESLKFSGMSATQAATFASTYTVVQQYSDPVSGLSVTLFEKGGQKFMAVRGTEPLDKLWSYISQFGIQSSQVQGLAQDYFTDAGILLGQNGKAQYQALQTCYQQWKTSGLIGPLERLNVTGHSMGGMLAQMLTWNNPVGIAQTVTVNSPGLDGAFAQFLQTLGLLPASIPVTNISNVVAQEGQSITSGMGTMLGNTLPVFIEEGVLISNHSIAALTDSLAVYNLLATLDPVLNTDPNGLTRITNILKASSNVAANSLESAISSLGKLFLVSGAVGFSANEFDANRDLLYKAVQDIAAALPANGGLSLVAVDAATILADAKAATPDALASRYALVNGNPFVVKGADYGIHNNNGELDLFDHVTHSGSLTNQYLTDRANYLKWQLQANVADKSVLIGDKGPQNTLYQDSARHTTLAVNGDVPGFASTAPARRIVFGSDFNDDGSSSLSPVLQGGTQDDRLYGMGGNPDRTTSHSTKPPNDNVQVVGYSTGSGQDQGNDTRNKQRWREVANDQFARWAA